MANLREAARLLRQRVPAAFPVRVRRDPLPTDRHGDAALVRGRKPHFVIRIDQRLRGDFAVWVLLHEWAHCRAWSLRDTHGPDWEEHGPAFGVAYAECWRAYTEE